MAEPKDSIVRVRWRTRGKVPAQWIASEPFTRSKAERLAARLRENDLLEVEIGQTQIARACQAILASWMARSGSRRAQRARDRAASLEQAEKAS